MSPLPPMIACQHLRSAARRSRERLRVAKGERVVLEAWSYRSNACRECIDLVGKVFEHDAQLPALPLRGCFAEDGCDLRVSTYWEHSDDDDEDWNEDDGSATSAAPATTPKQDPAARLEQARRLLELGLLDEDEYQSVKEIVLRELRGEGGDH